MAKLFTQIRKVSIFRNGAEIIREGKTKLEKGNQTLYIYGLTGTASTDTARLFSDEELSCSDLRFEIMEESDEIKELEQQIDEIRKQIEVADFQISLWKDNGDFTSKNTQSVTEVENYIEKLPERIGSLQQKIREYNHKIEELEKTLEEKRTSLSQPVAIAEVDAKEAGEYSFELHYHENAAGWNPIYEVHSDGKNDLEIRMRGKIHQSTSEDWKEVGASLFTGNPSTSSVLPKLNTQYLEIQEQEKIRYKANANAGMGMMMASVAMEDTAVAEKQMMRVVTEEAIEENDETMSEYVLNGRKDFLKNKETTADLKNYDIPTRYQIITAAKADPNAYLVGELKTADLPLLTSSLASIYLKGMYTGKTYLNNDLSEETICITLGKEERIHVSYKEVTKKTSSAMLKNQKTTEYLYETLIHNLGNEDVRILYRDQIPVSHNKEIVVEMKDTGLKLEEETGFVEKEVEVKSKDSKTLQLSYKVSWPKDKRITTTRQSSTRYCPECGSKVEGRFCPECGSAVY